MLGKAVNKDEGVVNLRHNTFMCKVPKVLGEINAHKFVGYYIAVNGKQNPCYYFLIREAHIMIGSESYKIQAAVYDKAVGLNNP